MKLSLLRALLILLPLWASNSDCLSEEKLHIVHLGALPSTSTTETVVNSHVQLLSYVKTKDISTPSNEAEIRNALVLSYTNSFNGFAAMLSGTEAEAMKEMPGVLSVFPSEHNQVLTTRSWDFVGLTSTSPRNPSIESDIIIGIIDTGVWPESKMFDDTNVGPIPSSWKGGCQTGDQFTASNCNRKLIGAKYFVKGLEAEFGRPLNTSFDYLSPRDTGGHGSHVSSTAGGSIVEGANLYGLATGTARGAVPAARIAMYKACWISGVCTDADVLAAFDEAIADGVDLISVSLGFIPKSYNNDGIAIGAFHAIQKGVVVAAAMGNSGTAHPPTNVAPWIITVAASTIDREFYSPLVLGNNVTVKGKAINTVPLNDTWYPIIAGPDGNFENTTIDLSYCDAGALDSEKVKGKIVYCGGGDDPFDAALNVSTAGGAGLIYADRTGNTGSDVFVVPTTVVKDSDADTIAKYINETRSPVAKILPCEVALNQAPAPVTADFSSRGPNILSPDILKPDLSAPGVDIIAAWSLNDPITEEKGIDKRYSKFNILSGTSMSTPHVTGAAAYVKSFHPDWSPAAIKSALMTTAISFDPTNPLNADLEFGYGAGNINPTKAIDPGLIYDIVPEDYALFLCSHGYNSTTLSQLTGTSSMDCPSDSSMPYRLNYPAVVGAYTYDFKNDWHTTTRTLTYVGKSVKATFIAKLQVPGGMEVEVSPKRLFFSGLGEKASFQVKLRAPGLGSDTSKLSGSLVWESNGYAVRSPILAFIIAN